MDTVKDALKQLLGAEGEHARVPVGLGLERTIALVERINHHFGTTLPTDVLDRHPDLDALAMAIHHELAGSGPAEGIAIVGMAARAAGAASVDELWEVIRTGRDATTTVDDPTARELFARHFPGRRPPRIGVLAGAEDFDPAFFRIAPSEAAMMDAAQRVLLECAYHALEDAAIDPGSLARRPVATLVGSTGLAPQTEFSARALLGSDTSIMAARLAYHLDLSGPALTVDTACSSSLVAIDEARRMLLAGEIELALAGGVYVSNHPGSHVTMEALGIVSPTRRCRPFDAEADGVLVGEGVGVLVLKRLSDALRDNDRIHGVILATGANQDGRTNGITSPSYAAQRSLVTGVLARAGIAPRELGYLEAHGTGTTLGDPIEVHGLTDSLAGVDRPCPIGSLKANIGHTMGAAGVLGVIKVLLCLREHTLPPTANFTRPNPHIDFDEGVVAVQRELAPWPQNPSGRRIGAVSSFGYSGTNAHAVIADWTPPARPAGRPARQIVPLSAKTPAALAARAADLAAALRRPGAEQPELRDLAYTLQVGREAMPERAAVRCDTMADLLAQLDELAVGRVPHHAGRDRAADAEADAAPLDRSAADEQVAALWCAGRVVDWARRHTGDAPRRIGLPGYPFERTRFPHAWTAAGASSAAPSGEGGATGDAVPSVLPAVDDAVAAFLAGLDGSAGAAARTEAMAAELSAWCRTMLVASLRRMGIAVTTGERFTADGLAARLQVVPEHRRLFGALLRILVDAGVLRPEGTQIFVTTGEADDPQPRWGDGVLGARRAELAARYPELAGFARLLDSCLDALPEVLTGARKAHEVLFPDGSFDAVGDVYHSGAAANELVATVIGSIVRARLAQGDDGPLSLLEVGAGTGGTTASVLPVLAPYGDRVAYRYTDVSRSFARYGAQRYGRRYAFLEVGVLDIEAAPEQQGFTPGSADVVLASNVLHATRRIDVTLARITRLLRPGGVLVLMEATRAQEVFTLTFGLMSGWWAFEDERLPDAPLLSVGGWRRALERNGLGRVRALSTVPVREDRAPESVIVAERDGARPHHPRGAAGRVSPAPVPPPDPVTPPASGPTQGDGNRSGDAGATGGAEGSACERLVAAAWCEVLGVTSVEVDDDFQERGGDSIMANQIIARLRARFPVDLELGGLFEARSVRQMAALVEAELVRRIDELPEDAVRDLLA